MLHDFAVLFSLLDRYIWNLNQHKNMGQYFKTWIYSATGASSASLWLLLIIIWMAQTILFGPEFRHADRVSNSCHLIFKHTGVRHAEFDIRLAIEAGSSAKRWDTFAIVICQSPDVRGTRILRHCGYRPVMQLLATSVGSASYGLHQTFNSLCFFCRFSYVAPYHASSAGGRMYILEGENVHNCAITKIK